MATGKKTLLISSDSIDRLISGECVTIASNSIFKDGQEFIVKRKGKDAGSIRAKIQEKNGRVQGRVKFLYTLSIVS